MALVISPVLSFAGAFLIAVFALFDANILRFSAGLGTEFGVKLRAAFVTYHFCILPFTYRAINRKSMWSYPPTRLLEIGSNNGGVVHDMHYPSACHALPLVHDMHPKEAHVKETQS